jgi:hypothetical protein
VTERCHSHGPRACCPPSLVRSRAWHAGRLALGWTCWTLVAVRQWPTYRVRTVPGHPTALRFRGGFPPWRAEVNRRSGLRRTALPQLAHRVQLDRCISHGLRVCAGEGVREGDLQPQRGHALGLVGLGYPPVNAVAPSSGRRAKVVQVPFRGNRLVEAEGVPPVGRCAGFRITQPTRCRGFGELSPRVLSAVRPLAQRVEGRYQPTLKLVFTPRSF